MDAMAIGGGTSAIKGAWGERLFVRQQSRLWEAGERLLSSATRPLWPRILEHVYIRRR